MTPPFINVSRTVAATSTDPSYINTFTVTGLKPNTNYTASVRAVSSLLDVSCMEQGVDLPGPISNEVSFITMLGGECNHVTLLFKASSQYDACACQRSFASFVVMLE